jgi:hypothetical protein
LLKILTCITKNTTFSDGYFRPALFPNKNAPIAMFIVPVYWFKVCGRIIHKKDELRVQTQIKVGFVKV